MATSSVSTTAATASVPPPHHSFIFLLTNLTQSLALVSSRSYNGGDPVHPAGNTKFKKLDIFYKIKITYIKYHHNCELTTIFHHKAKGMSGNAQPDLWGLNHILSLLREKPNLTAEVLPLLLLKYVSTYTSMNAAFIRNFHSRATHFILHNDAQSGLLANGRCSCFVHETINCIY
eukprot:scaffold97455_cov78-Attheya_sp.AAC.2